MSLRKRTLYLTSKIPKGKITTYGEISKALGNISFAQAVGQILKTNPYAPFVPCHRVVHSDGQLGGYGGAEGQEKKKSLLQKEGIKIKGHQIKNLEEYIIREKELKELL